ncbi:unnamed protein product [Rotaria sp. Silwood2]|nr:unnamed protein product [Rotaria sp. Silwood2]
MESSSQLKSLIAGQDDEHSTSKDNISKKIFIPTIGTLGDVKPFLILAEELKKRGHTVWLGVHKRFQDLVQGAAGLSCMEKFPNTKAIGIYTFPSLRTAEFSPPGFGGKSESMFGWINTMKWKMFEHVSFNMYNNEINQLRASIDLPPIKESVPHSWLFLNMSAAIHHGGVGTTHASLRYGLPTLILPFGADQPFNDDRIFINKLGPRYIF